MEAGKFDSPWLSSFFLTRFNIMLINMKMNPFVCLPTKTYLIIKGLYFANCFGVLGAVCYGLIKGGFQNSAFQKKILSAILFSLFPFLVCLLVLGLSCFVENSLRKKKGMETFICAPGRFSIQIVETRDYSVCQTSAGVYVLVALFGLIRLIPLYLEKFF